jgi:hypothetical protein
MSAVPSDSAGRYAAPEFVVRVWAAMIDLVDCEIMPQGALLAQ